MRYSARFRPTQGLYVATDVAVAEYGLHFEPGRTFTPHEIAVLYRGALTFLDTPSIRA